MQSTMRQYLSDRRRFYRQWMPDHIGQCMISEENYLARSRLPSGEEAGVHVQTGDICWIDYGQTYLNEMGFQHFGLIIKICYKKALVVPMTSNVSDYQKAYDPLENPEGNVCLMRLGIVEGMRKVSTLFLNDMRFINTARVFAVMAHLDVQDPLFIEVELRLKKMLESQDFQ